MTGFLRFIVFLVTALLVFFAFHRGVEGWLLIVIFLGVGGGGNYMVSVMTRAPDPTKDWRRLPDLDLTFDLDRAELNGVRLGERLDRLSFLGPAEDRALAREGELCYHSLGLCVELEDDMITNYRIIWRDPYEEKYEPFPGSVEYHSNRIALEDLTEATAIGEFGEPSSRDDEDEEEVVLFYEFSELKWDIEFDTESRFNCLMVMDE